MTTPTPPVPAAASTISLRLPGELAYRDIALRTISGACKLVAPKSQSNPSFTHQFVSAFGEAFNNIVLHAYQHPTSRGEVIVEIFPAPSRLDVRLLDYGLSFDPQTIPPPDLDRLPESGMGLYIIRSFIDEISYHPGSPNILRLTKYLLPPADR